MIDVFRGERKWQVRVLLTGEVLYSFRWKVMAVAVGEAVAREREMKFYVRNRRGMIIERRDYKPVDGTEAVLRTVQAYKESGPGNKNPLL